MIMMTSNELFLRGRIMTYLIIGTDDVKPPLWTLCIIECVQSGLNRFQSYITHEQTEHCLNTVQ
jgi:hypothetical protein